MGVARLSTACAVMEAYITHIYIPYSRLFFSAGLLAHLSRQGISPNALGKKGTILPVLFCVCVCEFVYQGGKRATSNGGSAGNTKIIWIPVVVFVLHGRLYPLCTLSVKFLGVQQETEGASQYLCTYIGGRDNE